MTQFICISGKAQHGKDTSAQMIKEYLTSLGYQVLITHYADLLKFICRNYFGWDGNKDNYGRSLLQTVGTEKIRAKNPDYWVNHIIDIVKFFPDQWDYIIIPDARFPNELSKISDNGYRMHHIQVIRPGFDNGLTPEQLSHSSENALNNVMPDYTVYNNSLPQLKEVLRGVCNVIIKERKRNENS